MYDLNKNFEENKLMSFVNQLEQERQIQKENDMYENDPVFKQRKFEKSKECCRKYCTDEFFGRLYLNSLPLDDDYKEQHADELKAAMAKFIDANGGDRFIAEKIKETDSPILKTIVEASNEVVNNYENRIAQDFDMITVSDLDYRPSDDDDKFIDKISGEMEFDEIQEVIKTKVKDAVSEEIERSRYEEEKSRELQEELASDETITDEVSLEAALSERMVNNGKIYQPSLFEAILNNKMRMMTEATSENMDIAFGNAVAEYTLHEVAKTLRLNKYEPSYVIKLTDKYAQ